MHLIPHNPNFQRPWERELFKNIVGKGENAGNQHFLLFPQCFLPFPNQISGFDIDYFVVCKCFEFGPQSLFLSSCKELNVRLSVFKFLNPLTSLLEFCLVYSLQGNHLEIIKITTSWAIFFSEDWYMWAIVTGFLWHSYVADFSQALAMYFVFAI